MKRFVKAAYSLVSLAVLSVFTFTTCGSPFFENLPTQTDTYVLEVGKGTPRFFYLDEDYNPITDTDVAVDPGRTVFYIEDNPLAEGAMVIADSTGENNDVVRMLETAEDIKINFFFRKGEQFPWAIDFVHSDQTFSARLSGYNQETEQYAVTFEVNGEYASASGLVLNKNVLNCYVDDPAMNEIQNTRMREIYTALGLYASLGQLVSGDDNLVFRGFWSGLASFFKKIIKPVFKAVAFVATVVATLLTLPPVIAVISVLCPPIATALPVISTVAGAIGMAAGAVAYLLIPDAEDGQGGQGSQGGQGQGGQGSQGNPASPDSPASTQPPSVAIAINGNPIPADPKHIYQFGAAGDETVFDLSFVNYSAQPRILLYEPETKKYIMELDQRNSCFFEVRNENGDQLQGAGSVFYLNTPSDQIKVKRNGNIGRVDDGKLYVLIDFGMDVLINGTSREVDDFYLPNEANNDANLLSPGETRRFYVLRFQVTA